MEKYRFLKSLFTSSEDYERYSIFMTLQACKDFKIEPKDFVLYADGELHDQLGDILFMISPISQQTINLLNEYYNSKKEYKQFKDRETEIYFHQAVVFTHAINHNLKPIDIKNLEIGNINKYKRHDLNTSLSFLKQNNLSYIDKSWEKDLIKYLMSRNGI